MVLKLYGYPMSTCTRLVALTCKEKNIPYELVLIKFANREHKAAEYVKIQPFGQVPYIVVRKPHRFWYGNTDHCH